MKSKRKNSLLLPIKYEGEELCVYFQKRSPEDEKFPGHFGFWGGGAEGEETPEEALIREVREELGIDLNINRVKLFNSYEFLKGFKFMYLFEPEEGWEKDIVIGEGDYGKWFTTTEAIESNCISLEDKVVMNDLERALLNWPMK